MLIRELMQGLGLSRHDLARRSGRDVSWVSRRLQLLSGLPDAALTAVRDGRLSSWSANRIVVPLARANTGHAERLLTALAEATLSSRELHGWFEHYQKASRRTRERMVSHPRLFLDALRANGEQHAGERLRDGPEGECAAELRSIEAILARLRQRVAALRPLPRTLIDAAPRLRATVEALISETSGRARMTPTEIRSAVCTLQAKGHSLREISRSLALSRNTVRRILRQPKRTADETAPCDEATLARLKAAFERARGNVVRVQELLADDGLAVRYSTLTRWAREAGLRSPPRRAGEYDFAPGQEMQHDTSPHRVLFAKARTSGKIVTVQCAGLVLAYSRRLFIQYYPRFTVSVAPAPQGAKPN
jgi:transposase/transcriptional regulator with XRE-family HTH domain